MKYFIYGSIVESDLDLFPCPRVGKSKARPEIRLKQRADLPLRNNGHVIHRLKDRRGRTVSQFVKNKNQYIFEVWGVGAFAIGDQGRHIAYRFYPAISQAAQAIWLAHHALPLALSQLNILVLHGASVVIGRKAKLIIGHAGLGKSTIAYEFYRRGYRVLSDDAIVLRWRNKRVQTCSGFPAIRLRRRRQNEKLKILFKSPRSQTWFEVESLHLPILSKKKVAVKKMPALDAIPILLAETFRISVDNTRHSIVEFDRILKLCRAVPLLTWSYVHNQSALNRAQKYVLQKQPKLLPFEL